MRESNKDKYSLMPVFDTVIWVERPTDMHGIEERRRTFRKIGVMLDAGYQFHGQPILMGEGHVMQALVLWPDDARPAARFGAAA